MNLTTWARLTGQQVPRPCFSPPPGSGVSGTGGHSKYKDLKASGELRNSKQEHPSGQWYLLQAARTRGAPAKKANAPSSAGVYNFETIGRQICRGSHPTLSALENPQFTCTWVHSLHRHWETAAALHCSVEINLLFLFFPHCLNQFRSNSHDWLLPGCRGLSQQVLLLTEPSPQPL